MIRVNRGIAILIATLLLSNACSLSQDTSSTGITYGNGITLYGGVSYLAVRDEYLSLEKYTGTLPLWGLAWSRFSNTSAYRVTFEYQSTTHLKSYNVSADLHLGSLRLDFLFPIGAFELMDRKASIWLGPGWEFFAHTQREHIADDVKESSTVSSSSGNINGEVFYPLASSVQVEAMSSLSLLSLAGKTVPQNNSGGSIKLLSLISFLRAQGEIHLRYRFSDFFSAFAGYRFELTRATAWDYFLTGNDQLFLAITYDL
jgi:hypothetical protein